ncbi:hypothetical protein CXB51_016879 [Gossypium anomalum]|uniref:RNase H type-1 domain-containing protein n=1 Tax=Gossypium anomalum TaxID=47600 RepID=A0A8J5YX33_9ROSI|nr:hypothetical protein CXB51_016879 [Gossypium anomalum]
MQLGLDLGLQNVEIEGDSLTVIKKLQKKTDDKSEIHALVRDRLCLQGGFRICQFKYGFRDINKVAHMLAKKGFKKGEQWDIMITLPEDIAAEVEKDCKRISANWTDELQRWKLEDRELKRGKKGR